MSTKFLNSYSFGFKNIPNSIENEGSPIHSHKKVLIKTGRPVETDIKFTLSY